MPVSDGKGFNLKTDVKAYDLSEEAGGYPTLPYAEIIQAYYDGARERLEAAKEDKAVA